jgi:dTDP-glucose pyrophosphorylase/LPS sulfotransferase NodH
MVDVRETRSRLSSAEAIEHYFQFDRAYLEQEYLPYAGERAVIEEFRQLDRKFLVLCASRSGSGFLCHLLRDFGATPAESLSFAPGAPEKLAFLGTPTIRAAIAELCRSSPNRVLGARGTGQIVAPLLLYGELPAYRHEWRFVALRRHNVLQQAISLMIAEKTGIWRAEAGTTLALDDDDYDALHILRCMDAIARVNAHVARLVSGLGVATFHLSYEELTANPRAATDAVGAFLGLERTSDRALKGEDPAMPPPAIRRTGLNDRWEERFRREVFDFDPPPPLVPSAIAPEPMVPPVTILPAAERPTAVVLAGGRGMRLRPYTTTIPKPLVPVGDRPIVEVMIRRLCRCGFGRIVLAVNHMGDLIQAYFGDGRRWNVDISYTLETEPLGTIAPLRLVRDLPEHFIVTNADILTDLEFDVLLDRHRLSGALLTVATTRREQQLDYGVLQIEEGRVVNLHEKPVIEQMVSMGLYAVSRRALDLIPPDGRFGVDQLILKAIASGEQVATHHHRGFWLDVGRPDDYERANLEMMNDADRFA